jgi:hypothetical protein
MNEEVWQSIKAKVIGQYLAAQNLPTACATCGKILNPVDVGVDPQTNERLWLTACCGNIDRYLEVLGEVDLI